MKEDPRYKWLGRKLFPSLRLKTHVMRGYMEKQTIRVAVLTALPRDVRVIGIVLTHLKSAKHVFAVADKASTAPADIALVDDTDSAMRNRLAAAQAVNPNLAVVYIVRELGKPGVRVELQSSQLMMQLLSTLEHLVARQGAASEAATAPARPVAADKPAQARKDAPTKLRALVVDDSQTVRIQLATVMSKIGMACDIADGARAALNQLAHQQYDLIYVDVMMPDMDGYTLTREIKRDRSNKAPVIILTSQSSPFDRARGALAGCDSFLTKPVGLKQFYAATTKALRKSMAVDDLSGWIVDPTELFAQAQA